MALRTGRMLIDVNRRVDPPWLLVYEVPDRHGIEPIQKSLPVVARADVNEIRGLAGSVRRGAILLAGTTVSGALALKNRRATEVKILNCRNWGCPPQRQKANTRECKKNEETFPHERCAPSATGISRNFTYAQPH